jgi:hypothetical protein
MSDSPSTRRFQAGEEWATQFALSRGGESREDGLVQL